MKIVEIVKANPKVALAVAGVVVVGAVGTGLVLHIKKTRKAKKEALPEAQDSETQEETEE